jgi:DNA-binding NarL/FixJ family response regulator
LELSNAASPLEQLSSREREILQLVAEGKTSQEIAEKLSISPKTVDTYRSRLMRKIGVDDVTGLVKFAIQHGVISLE